MKLDNRLNAMTVDVEDYFQVSAFEGVVDKSDWDSIGLRVPGSDDGISPGLMKMAIVAGMAF